MNNILLYFSLDFNLAIYSSVCIQRAPACTNKYLSPNLSAKGKISIGCLSGLNAHTKNTILLSSGNFSSALCRSLELVANGIISVSKPTGAHSALVTPFCFNSFTTAGVLQKTFVFLNAEKFLLLNLSIIQREIALGEELCTVPT